MRRVLLTIQAGATHCGPCALLSGDVEDRLTRCHAFGPLAREATPGPGVDPLLRHADCLAAEDAAMPRKCAHDMARDFMTGPFDDDTPTPDTQPAPVLVMNGAAVVTGASSR